MGAAKYYWSKTWGLKHQKTGQVPWQMMQKNSLSNLCLTNVRNLEVFLEVHGRDIIWQNQSKVIIWLAQMQMQLQLDCSCHFTGRDIYQSHTPLYAYMWNGIKPIFNQVFDPITLTCCFCFWRMLRIQVWLSRFKFGWVKLFDAGTGHTYKEN